MSYSRAITDLPDHPGSGAGQVLGPGPGEPAGAHSGLLLCGVSSGAVSWAVSAARCNAAEIFLDRMPSPRSSSQVGRLTGADTGNRHQRSRTP
jgi:hypothetical protein